MRCSTPDHSPKETAAGYFEDTAAMQRLITDFTTYTRRIKYLSENQAALPNPARHHRRLPSTQFPRSALKRRITSIHRPLLRIAAPISPTCMRSSTRMTILKWF